MKDLNHLFGRIPIRIKLLILTTGLATVPVISYFLFSALVGFNEMRQISVNSLQNEARTIGYQVDDFLHNLDRYLQHLSHSPFLREFIVNQGTTEADHYREQVEQQLKQLMSVHPFYYQLRFINAEGMEVIRAENKNGKIHITPIPELQNKRHRYYFQETMKLAPGQVYVSPMDFNIEHHVVELPKLPVFRYGTPVDLDGTRQGIFVINIFGRSLVDVLKGMPALSYQQLSLVDKAGRMVASGTQKRDVFDLFLDVRQDPDKRIRDLLSLPHPPGNRLKTSVRDLMVLYPIVTTSDNGHDHWNLVLTGNRDKIIQPFITFGGYSLVILVVCILLSIGFGLLTTRHFYRPILRLREGARRVTEGDYHVEVPISTNDELEDLANDFSRMTSTLESRDRQIQRHHSELEHLIEQRTREIVLEKEKLERVVEGVGAGLVLIDRRYQIVWCNEYFIRKLHGINLPSMINCCELLGSELGICPNGNNALNCPELERVFASEVVERSSHEILCRDGERRTYMGRVSPIRDESGEIIFALFILYDITEKELIERRERELQQQLERAEKLTTLGRFTAGIAHEVGNPLGAIGITAQAVQEEFSEDSPQWQQLALIVSEIQRLSKITRDLNALGKPSPPELMPHDPDDILTGLQLLIEGEAKAKGIKLEIHNHPCPGTIHVDAQQIQQVLLNLVVNAFESMQKGGSLKLECKPDLSVPEEPRTLFSVADSGEGIPAEKLETIFEPFYTTKTQGTGFGLTLAHNLVSQNHGSLSVESATGEGSTFFLRFPLKTEATGETPESRETVDAA